MALIAAAVALLSGKPANRDVITERGGIRGDVIKEKQSFV
jgi:hypothetical protein